MVPNFGDPFHSFPPTLTLDQNFPPTNVLFREVESVPFWIHLKLSSCIIIKPKFQLCTHSISQCTRQSALEFPEHSLAPQLWLQWAAEL